MRQQTLQSHLNETEQALLAERGHVARQESFIRELEFEGHDITAAKELCHTMQDRLRPLERHRQRLLEQLGRLNVS